MKKAFLKSIRFRIIVLYLVILSCTLGILRFMLYADYRRSLQSQLDKTLLLKAAGIDESIKMYWQAQAMNKTKDVTRSFLFFTNKKTEKDAVDHFGQIADQLTESNLSEAGKVDTISFIFDSYGVLIASSQDVDNCDLLKREAVLTAVAREVRYSTFRVNLFNNKTIPVRIISKPVFENDKVRYVTQVIASLMPLNAQLNELKRNFFLQIPIIIFIAVAGALFLVQATLNPVKEMIETVRKINPDTLRLRLPVSNVGDEITQLARTFNVMFDELEKSFLSQQQIVQDISHELKTPLAILRGQHEVALRQYRTPEEYREILESNLEEIEKMKDIINNLLMLARFDKGAALMSMTEVNVNQAIRSAIKDTKDMAEAKTMDVRFLEDQEDILVKGNDVYLKLLFRNIIENAIKYTNPSGSVGIELSVFQPFAHIQVTDTGVGIEEKNLPLIFNRFYRVDKARSSGAGFGLGLSIVKSIVDLHKGKILVQSAIGQGTTFIIQIPLAA